MAKFASPDAIGATVTYTPTGATGTVLAVDNDHPYHSDLLLETESGFQMWRNVEDCSIAFAPASVELFDRVTLRDFSEVVTGIVLDIAGNYLLVRSDDDQTFWDSERRFVAKVERAVRVEWADTAERVAV